MFNVGGGEVIVVLLLALLLLGPEKLPEAARKVGKFLAEVRRVTTGFQEEVRSAIDMGPGAKVVDLLDSTEPGPRLDGPPAADGTVTPPVPPTSPTNVSTPSSTAFVADLSPAPTPPDTSATGSD